MRLAAACLSWEGRAGAARRGCFRDAGRGGKGWKERLEGGKGGCKSDGDEMGAGATDAGTEDRVERKNRWGKKWRDGDEDVDGRMEGRS